MLLHQLFSQLEKSEVFQKFKSENPEAFLCAGFFILNFKAGIFDYSLDFKSNNKIFTFKIPVAGDIVMLEEDILDTQKPLEKITLDVQIDINDLRDIVEKEISIKGIKSKLEEIIAVLQNVNLGKGDLRKVDFGKVDEISKVNPELGKPLGCHTIWNLTCMCEGLVIITVHIDPESGKIIKFEKKSLFDMIKK